MDEEELSPMNEEMDIENETKVDAGVGQESPHPFHEDDNDQNQDLTDTIVPPENQSSTNAHGVQNQLSGKTDDAAMLSAEEDQERKENVQQEVQGNNDQKSSHAQSSQQEGSGDDNSGENEFGFDQNQQLSKPQLPSDAHELPNPFKEKGDLLSKWHRRLMLDENMPRDQKDNSRNESVDEQNVEMDVNNQLFEFGVSESQRQDQVLGDVSESDAVRLPTDSEIQHESQPLDKQQDNYESTFEEENSTIKQKDEKEKQDPTKKRKRSEVSPQETQQSTTRKKLEDLDNQKDTDGDDNNSDQANDAEFADSVDDPVVNNFDNRILIDVNLMHDTNNSSNIDPCDDDGNFDTSVILTTVSKESFQNSRLLWSQHRQLTEVHSARLCEQLRLVLEPTVASRLQGDYRSGKRINMRKIISYIASGFRKDKIWLRRTKPAKRSYQILLMIDDSLSMGGVDTSSANHGSAGLFALSALTTLASAMTRLEVGEICIAKFSDSVQVIHPFGKVFDDESGVNLYSQFSFSSHQTRLSKALQSVISIFETAVTSNNNLDAVLQLCFVISDARIDSDNRFNLNKTIRDLNEKNILVVLLIIDINADPKDSIFNTKTVEFRDNKILTSSYFDNFPFPFYVTVQELQMLPDVLTDALKQWFEMTVTTS